MMPYNSEENDYLSTSKFQETFQNAFEHMNPDFFKKSIVEAQNAFFNYAEFYQNLGVTFMKSALDQFRSNVEKSQAVFKS